MRTTALVIGGGATGVGVARDLALRGVDTTLVERGALAAGTTGRSHGVLHSGARYAETDSDDAAACLAENRILRDIAPACIEETGGYFLHLDGDDPDYFERKRTACEELGMAVETLSGAAFRERVPEASPAVERALAVPDAVVSPARLVVANAHAARDAGATLHTHAPVEDIHVDGGEIDRVDVGGRLDATIRADTVVNATGPWAEECAALAGVSVPMRPTRGVMVAVPNPGVDAVLNRCRPPADGDIVVPRADEAVLGTTSVAVGDPDDFERTDAEVERTVAECAAMCPGVDAPVRRTYWGVRPLYAPDEAARGDARAISRDFALLGHRDEGAAGLYTIVGGKLTTYRRMAEATADRVCDRLGVSAACRTAERPLPGADDPAELDGLLDEFGVDAPADGR
ncbi:FAD-dependent oxidoreductase [Haloplanus aerogenes]|uniref:Glycerol-3-phosphate dehydrogenase n=1 Tax=Haloplanus aerogenes TaxID=660522 RepID=A0A3M0DG07_9EURY|nr:glycerol-3-phosphate dehydrogenase/oxidase [Haloplanus aerogenes]AZH26303.1 FAD-dependent oxidoreductase [Haloplanus aerogenes]RMB18239.1 glycerol-3-phosphate dehydrogenase [Haloplanus aerogenes]